MINALLDSRGHYTYIFIIYSCIYLYYKKKNTKNVIVNIFKQNKNTSKRTNKNHNHNIINTTIDYFS